jgi:hypothetical protein
MYAAKQYREGLTTTRQRIASTPDDADLYWLAARFIYEVGELSDRDSDVDKLGLYTEMLALCEKGLKVSPGNPHLLFARGIANGRIGTTRGVLASLFLAKSIETDWLAVTTSDYVYSSIENAEMMPCDTYQALGIFYRLVPDWWIVQVLAGTRGDLDKSLELLEKADTCGPNRMGVVKELAVTQLCIGTKRNDDAMLAKGKANVRRYMSLPAVNDKRRIDHKHGQMLLDDPDMACEYSRDGQQDMDKAKLDK